MIANIITSSDASKLLSSSTTTTATTTTTTTITATTPLTPRSIPKDRLKAFTLEFDESVKIQRAASVPDVELRDELRGKIKDIVLGGYIIFYNQ